MPKDMDAKNQLTVSIGQYSDAGRKPVNQDFHGALIPSSNDLTLKGITLAIADGISSSPVSQQAAETIVKALMSDYYCTSDAWPVKTAASRVINATNSWLYAQNRRDRVSDMNRGLVCTLSALVLKGHSAHLFHVGDSRIWQVSGDSLEPLTQDHRIELSASESYLGRSIGSEPQVEIDYKEFTLSRGDIFLLTTDGVHEHWDRRHVVDTLRDAEDLDQAAKEIATAALENGSEDNLTIQIVRVENLPDLDNGEGLLKETLSLPIPSLPKAGDIVDGFKIVRSIVSSARSHIYLATTEYDDRVVLKFPSVDLRESSEYLRRLVMEEWIARRIQSPHVLGPGKAPEHRSALYTVTEFVEGQTLRQWMTDNPTPTLEQVRDIIEQIARALRAFHRREMLHQDLRPENVMIDTDGTVKIIDFGSTRVAGVQEASSPRADQDILGTAQYTAPEYFLGYGGTTQSDLFSLGVITYELLTGRLPFGASVSRIRTQKDINRLTFKSTLASKKPLPDWVEHALRRATHPDSVKRYESSSEFIADLKRPSPHFKRPKDQPLIDKDPVLFWKILSGIFAATTIIALTYRF